MKTRLIFALKYLFFAFTAFTVPKMIVDSGRIVAPLEPSSNAPPNAPVAKSRSFWPFRFLSTSGSLPASSAVPPSAAARSSAFDGGADAEENAFYADFNGRANANVAPFRRNDDAFAAASANGSAFGFSDDAPDSLPDVGVGVGVGASRLSRANPSTAATTSDAPLSAGLPLDDRASFARFAESRLAPSAASTPFAADAAATSIFAGSPSSLASNSSLASPQTFEELFRFGHSPAWLVENWPRVDAVATDDGLVGYRVALSTGDGNDDLVGVFTCYFDATSERRVEFAGQTGDYRRILQFLQREYGVALSSRSTAERFVYESTLSNGRGGAVPGRLLVRPNRVFLRGAEKSFFDVDVVLERPYNRYN